MSDAAIEVSGLRRSYGALEAVRGIDLRVERGEIFAFLGPNGAGKTTTVEILEGFRTRDGGEVRVLGTDPLRADRGWRSRIGVVLQSCEVPGQLTVREALGMYAGYYPRPRGVEETIALVGLQEKADTRGSRLSGGQRRRLDVGLALIGDPELVFMDEPTTGFDPTARRQAWEVVHSLKGIGKTVFLTTHYMDEAQTLADRLAVIKRGEIVAEGTPRTLGGRDRAAATIRFSLPAGVSADRLPAGLGTVRAAEDGVLVQARDPVRALHRLTTWALERGHELGGLEVSQPSLEDVYLQLTAEEASGEVPG